MYIFIKKERCMSIVSEDLIVTEGWFQIVGVATEKARLPIFNLVLGTKSCFETDALKVREISEKYVADELSMSVEGREGTNIQRRNIYPKVIVCISLTWVLGGVNWALRCGYCRSAPREWLHSVGCLQSRSLRPSRHLAPSRSRPVNPPSPPLSKRIVFCQSDRGRDDRPDDQALASWAPRRSCTPPRGTSAAVTSSPSTRHFSARALCSRRYRR